MDEMDAPMVLPNEATLTLLLEDTAVTGLPGLTVQPGPGPAPDYSTELYRLYFACDADVELTLESQALTLQQSQLLTLSPGEGVRFIDDSPVQSLSFHHNFFCVRVQRNEVFCDGVVFNRLIGRPVVAFPPTEAPVLQAHFDELRRILAEQGAFSRERAINALRSVLLHAAQFKLSAAQGHQDDAVIVTRLSPLVLKFQTLVEETYTENKSATYYSEALGVTLVTLNRRVKDELGTTVMQTVNERLAIAARAALRSGKRSVKDVAFDLGFSDPLYFSRFFSKQFGAPPSRYFAQRPE